MSKQQNQNQNRIAGVRVTFIDGTKHAKCQFCGKVAELRPYGPKGESVCFECAMKDEKAAAAQFKKAVLDKSDIVIIK